MKKRRQPIGREREKTTEQINGLRVLWLHHLIFVCIGNNTSGEGGKERKIYRQIEPQGSEKKKKGKRMKELEQYCF